jgi:hypothetical protein
MAKIMTKYSVWIVGGLLAGIYWWGVKNMFFHQDDLDWFLLAQKPFWQVMGSPIGDHVNYVFRLLLKLEWELFQLYFPLYLMVSVVMHAINIWLIYKLGTAISGRRDLSALAALLFTINTNWTEVVLWTSGQTISITAIFVLLAMYNIWKKRGEVVSLLMASSTSALALGLLGSTGVVYKKMRWQVVLIMAVVGVIYAWKGTDGTAIAYSLDWLIKVGAVWGLMMINSVMGRLIIPFDRFEMIRIVSVIGLATLGLWKWRTSLGQIWRDNWSRFLIIQIALYQLIVAVGRAQYGVGIMRAERYSYLGLALLLLLGVRSLRKVKLGKWVWIVPVIVFMQCMGLYTRARAYVVRPQQMRQLFEEVKIADPKNIDPESYLPHFVLNDERLKYSDLLLLIND